MLFRALQGVLAQVTESAFSFEIIVVDNDQERSAENTVRLFQSSSAIKIVYDCEPRQNIALARNRAISNASGNLIAFIDDDEYPLNEWLLQLYRTMKEYDADGVLGPVIPHFPPGAPQWLKKGNIFDRRRLKTGTRLTERDTRTGNVLFSRSSFPNGALHFDPAFGLTGGEDVDFFRKHIKMGKSFIWCDSAEVYETVPPERWRWSFHLRKYLRIGALNGERLRRAGPSSLIEVIRTFLALPAWASFLLITTLLGTPLLIQPALKLAYAGSCLSAALGFSIVRHRD